MVRSIIYERGKYTDDLGYDSFEIYHKVLHGRVKQKKIKNIVNWNSHFFNLIELKAKTKRAKVKIIKKGTGRERIYNSQIIELSINPKIKKKIKLFASNITNN